MREIKFRAWRYNGSKADESLGQGVLMENAVALGWELEQYTGLKDKNGVEIYEGDILEFDAEEWGSPEGNKFTVTWNAKDGCWNCGGGTNRECSSFKAVIGNIHENPELLK